MTDEEQEKSECMLDALAEFAAGAGHEINNPLAIISGRAKILLEEITDTEHRRQLAVILAQVKRAYEMIADIRFFARPPLPEKTTFDIVAELGIIAEEQRTLISPPQENVAECSVNFSVENNVPSFFVNTDKTLFHCAVSFLCNNARDSLYLTGGNITIRLTLPKKNTVKDTAGENTTDENKIEVAVEDNGKGVSDDVVPLMFAPYYSGRQAGRGLGFGLPKCRKIMQILGGSVRYEKPAQCGARFVLTLPAD
jgi:signal transduction histidine kinase